MTTEPTQLARDDSASGSASGSASPDDWHEEGLPRVGDVVDGKYRVDRVLGAGGMGIVVAAHNLAIGVPVAMKFLRPSVAKDNESIERFKMEARASMRIHSEHVARVQDVATLPIGTPYMLMEYLEGEDLGQVTDRREMLPLMTACGFILEACEAIAEAHALGIVHRDLKPANLFLARRHDGSVCLKVLDFGISKAMGEGEQNPNMTDTRATFGSPTYMSPEQIRSSKRVDFRTDIWALGVCLHEILTGRPPFEAENVSGLLASIIADPPVPLRQHRPDAPEGLEEVILRCLEKNLTKRYQSIAELAMALQPFATRHSMTSLERVMRMSSSPSISSPRLEATQSSPSLVHARTEKSFGTSNSIAADAHRPSARKQQMVAGGVALGVLLMTGVAVKVVSSKVTHTDGSATAESADAGIGSLSTNASASASSVVLAIAPPTASAGSNDAIADRTAPDASTTVPGATAAIGGATTAATTAPSPTPGRHPLSGSAAPKGAKDAPIAPPAVATPAVGVTAAVTATTAVAPPPPKPSAAGGLESQF